MTPSRISSDGDGSHIKKMDKRGETLSVATGQKAPLDRKLHYLGAFLEIIAASEDVERTGKGRGKKTEEGSNIIIICRGKSEFRVVEVVGIERASGFQSSCFTLCFCVHASVLGCLEGTPKGEIGVDIGEGGGGGGEEMIQRRNDTD